MGGPGPEKRTAGIIISMDVLPYRLERGASSFLPGVSQASPRGGGSIGIRTHALVYRGELKGIVGLSPMGLSPATVITYMGLGQEKTT